MEKWSKNRQKTGTEVLQLLCEVILVQWSPIQNDLEQDYALLKIQAKMKFGRMSAFYFVLMLFSLCSLAQ